MAGRTGRRQVVGRGQPRDADEGLREQQPLVGRVSRERAQIVLREWERHAVNGRHNRWDTIESR